MFGPKLDARSYAIMILVIIAALIGGNLIAQTKSTSESTAELAAATSAVASATDRIADSNAQIAEAINSLADAVRAAGEQRNASAGNASRGNANQSGSANVPVGDDATVRITPENANPDRKKGVFELNNN